MSMKTNIHVLVDIFGDSGLVKDRGVIVSIILRISTLDNIRFDCLHTSLMSGTAKQSNNMKTGRPIGLFRA